MWSQGSHLQILIPCIQGYVWDASGLYYLVRLVSKTIIAVHSHVGNNLDYDYCICG